ncbi:hypothetical protein OH77DRAFT_1422633 [Trametes cingulata]|nr:hypothetical protein OH77DRAFT_1422633 [Trametes cingulata]
MAESDAPSTLHRALAGDPTPPPRPPVHALDSTQTCPGDAPLCCVSSAGGERGGGAVYTLRLTRPRCLPSMFP